MAKAKDKDMEEISGLLNKYSRTIANLETICARDKCRSVLDKGTFTWRFHLKIPKSYLYSGWLDHMFDDRVRYWLWFKPWPFSEFVARHFLEGHNLTDLIERSLIAMVGGASLLVPMIIMTFTTSREARLIIVSVAVLLFSLYMALATEATRENLLTATAAYAAVMVVYIGTSLPNSR